MYFLTLSCDSYKTWHIWTLMWFQRTYWNQLIMTLDLYGKDQKLAHSSVFIWSIFRQWLYSSICTAWHIHYSLSFPLFLLYIYKVSSQQLFKSCHCIQQICIFSMWISTFLWFLALSFNYTNQNGVAHSLFYSNCFREYLVSCVWSLPGILKIIIIKNLYHHSTHFFQNIVL